MDKYYQYNYLFLYIIMKFLIIFFILIVVIFLVFKKNIYFDFKKIYFLNTKNIKIIDKDLGHYINYISIHEIYDKIGYSENNKDIIKEIYKNNILDFSKKEKTIITKYINYIQKKYNYQFLKKNWNIIKISNFLEKGMPFTLGQFIYLPEHFIDNMININNQHKLKIYEVLIHEKIHILQRNNQQFFNNFYIKKLNYIYSNININKKWKMLHFKNPDGLDINWILKSKNQYFLPLLICKNHTIEEIVIKLNYKNKKFFTTNENILANKSKLFKYYPKNIGKYHPNEIVAYILPKIILNTQTFTKNIDIIFTEFLNSLKKF